MARPCEAESFDRTPKAIRLVVRVSALTNLTVAMLVAWASIGVPVNAPAQDKDPAPASDEPDEEAVAAQVERLGQALHDASKEPQAVVQAVAALRDPPGPAGAMLREFDRAGEYPAGSAGIALRREIYKALGRSGDFRSLHFLKETFEAQPTRRADATLGFVDYAVRHGRRAEEWQYLVRSLPFLDADHAPIVLQSLKTFPQRGSKPQAQREVILAGLRSAPADRDKAAVLLGYWTGAKVGDEAGAEEPLAAWQTWFAEKNPDLPPAELPVDPPQARHKFATLTARVTADLPQGDVKRGAAVYEKAQCGKCHRRQGQGEAMGPDLTSAPHRFDERLLLETLLFPSQSIADDYGAMSLVTRDGRAFTGVVNAAAGKVTVLQANGEKVALDRKQIEQMIPSRKSAMPDGILDAFDDRQIVDLVAFLLDREER